MLTFAVESKQPWITLPEGRSGFRDAACRTIRVAETTFRHPLLAWEDRDGELYWTAFHGRHNRVAQAPRGPRRLLECEKGPMDRRH
jgi:hypothetical protein